MHLEDLEAQLSTFSQSHCVSHSHLQSTHSYLTACAQLPAVRVRFSNLSLTEARLGHRQKPEKSLQL